MAHHNPTNAGNESARSAWEQVENVWDELGRMAYQEARRINLRWGRVVIEAGDLAAEAAIVLARKAHIIDWDQPFGYIRRVLQITAHGRTRIADIARTEPTDYGRHRDRRTPLIRAPQEDSHEDRVVDDITTSAVLTEAIRIVTTRIDRRLKGRQHSAAVAYFLLGQQPKTIAAAQGVAHPTIRRELAAAQRGLGTFLGDAHAIRQVLHPGSRRPQRTPPPPKLFTVRWDADGRPNLAISTSTSEEDRPDGENAQRQRCEHQPRTSRP